MTNKPLVSILIPSYNHSNYIEEAINSVLNQTYSQIELIVIDDGSNDTSVSIIQNLKLKKEFIFITRKNKGLSQTINEALSISNGKYFSICASDDKLDIQKIEKQLVFLENNLEYAMCYSKVIEFDNDGKEKKIDYYINHTGHIFKDLLKNNFIPAVTQLIRKDVFGHIGLFNEKSYIEDWEMWLRISKHFKIGFVDEYLAYYRKHDNYLSGNLLKMQESEEKIINQYQDSEYYDEAINEWNLRWFHNTSLCHKKEALFKYFFRVLKLKNLFRIKLYKAVVRLIIPCSLQR